MPVNIWQDPTKSLPKEDSQIVRVSMKQNEIAGRTDHIGSGFKSADLAISHVPNAGSKD
jgi:hypothetical protein